jgi:hypothetical protein
MISLIIVFVRPEVLPFLMDAANELVACLKLL